MSNDIKCMDCKYFSTKECRVFCEALKEVSKEEKEKKDEE